MVLGRLVLALAGLLALGFVLGAFVITHWSTNGDRERIQTTIVTTTR